MYLPWPLLLSLLTLTGDIDTGWYDWACLPELPVTSLVL